MPRKQKVDFRVVGLLDKRVYMHTEDPDLIPDDEIIKGMLESGYKAYLNGKVYKGGKVRGVHE